MCVYWLVGLNSFLHYRDDTVRFTDLHTLEELAAVKLEDGQVVVQVVMNNDMEPDSIFRVRDDANTLHIEPLPYSLEE